VGIITAPQKTGTARMLERRRTPRHQLGRVAAIMCGSGAEPPLAHADWAQ
jgi:hypothetical protein